MEPITREEMYLAAAAGYDVTPPEPITRKEIFLAKLAGMNVETPAAFTRQERFIEEAALAANACVIAPLEIAANGTYTAPEGVDGYNPVTVNVEGAETSEIVLEETTLTGFAANESFGGVYTKNCNFGTDLDAFEIVLGQEYIVLWDDIPYSVFAADASAIMPGALFLGNGSGFGLSGNGEPFVIGWNSGGVMFFGLTDTSESHSVMIIKRVRHEDIFLQDMTITENGEYTADAIYDGIGKVTVNVAGAGGSLPAGLYWVEDAAFRLPAYHKPTLFMYNGVLHLVCRQYSSGTNYAGYVYKYINGSWTQAKTITNASSDLMDELLIECNGKVHSYNSFGVHFTYDETNGFVALTQQSVKSVYRHSKFAQDGKLKICKKNIVYYWDESSDSLIQEATIGSTSDKVFFDYDGKIYCIDEKKLYEYSNATLTYLRDITGLEGSGISSYSARCAVYGRYLYCTTSTSPFRIFKIDIESGVTTYLGYAPNAGVPTPFVYDGVLRYHSYIDGFNRNWCMIPYEVTE